MRVADASVALKWFFRKEKDAHLASRLLLSGVPLIAPDLIFAECASAARNSFKWGVIPEKLAHDIFRELPGMLDEVVPSASLARDAFALAGELDHEIYDCFYLALALRRRVPVVTADKDFIKSANRAGHGDFIIHLADAATGRL